MNLKYIFLFFGLLFYCSSGFSRVRLPHVLCDGMVLQQNTEVRLWGWAKPDGVVKVTTSWDNNISSAKAGKDGKWLLKVKTPTASYKPLSVSFDDGDGKTTIDNILSGEVWVCAGQSNMQFPVRGFFNCPLDNYNETIVEAAKVHGIRYVKIPEEMRMTPQEDANCHWVTVDSKTVNDCSAVGYFFAKTVNEMLDIPVGLVLANMGGTRVEGWLDKDNLKKYTDEPLDTAGIVKKWSDITRRPMVWGNGTFNPILNLTVKGILYYQGCSNIGDPGNQYSDRLKLLVEQWRRDFKLGEIPFYFVQLVPYADWNSIEGTQRAMMYEQQVRAKDIIPNSDIVCTNDLAYPYEYFQIHPCQKKPVGERLAYVALKHNYGFNDIIAESPRYKSLEIEGDKCYVTFDNMDGGYSRFNDIEGFEVAGADKVFHKANAKIFWTPTDNPHNNSIVVSSDEVKSPVAVRYCFRNFQLGNLKNGGGIPLLPFRTDNW